MALGMPLLTHTLPWLGIRREDIGVSAVALALVLGVGLDAIDNFTWQVFEGLEWWPHWLFERRTKRWNDYVRGLHAEAYELRDKTEHADRVAALWTKLNEFPTAPDRTPIATRPTRLGNLIASYEEYPFRRYGMDAVFYWPRLWLKLPKDVRNEVERTWAVADGLIHLAAGLVLLGAAYVGAGLVSLAFGFGGVPFIFDSPDERVVSVYGGILLLLTWYVPYRLSFATQRANGMVFRAAFDLYRSSIEEMKEPNQGERDRWERLQDSLQYGSSAAADQAKTGGGEVL